MLCCREGSAADTLIIPARRLEFRAPDPSCNPYLAFSAMLMAGLDGIQRRIEPPTPIDEDLYELTPNGHKIQSTPGSLGEVLPGFVKERIKTSV